MGVTQENSYLKRVFSGPSLPCPGNVSAFTLDRQAVRLVGPVGSSMDWSTGSCRTGSSERQRPRVTTTTPLPTREHDQWQRGRSKQLRSGPLYCGQRSHRYGDGENPEGGGAGGECARILHFPQLWRRHWIRLHISSSGAAQPRLCQEE